ncbi:MAG: PilW family protein, partial [Proteobacteria bacterium]|nr:PilW family protein [Pseudomonadota bacterium]
TSDNIQKLGRKSTATSNNQPVSENIQALEFFYKLVDESQTLTPPDPTLIRSIRITMLARGDRADQKFVNTHTYTTPGGQNWGPYNDNFRRRLLTTTVKCRNLGL